MEKILPDKYIREFREESGVQYRLTHYCKIYLNEILIYIISMFFFGTLIYSKFQQIYKSTL